MLNRVEFFLDLDTHIPVVDWKYHKLKFTESDLGLARQLSNTASYRVPLLTILAIAGLMERVTTGVEREQRQSAVSPENTQTAKLHTRILSLLHHHKHDKNLNHCAWGTICVWSLVTFVSSDCEMFLIEEPLPGVICGAHPSHSVCRHWDQLGSLRTSF